MIFKMMQNLITRKFYQDKQIAIDLLNNFTAFEQISIDEYSNLMLLVDEVYAIVQEVTEDDGVTE